MPRGNRSRTLAGCLHLKYQKLPAIELNSRFSRGKGFSLRPRNQLRVIVRSAGASVENHCMVRSFRTFIPVVMALVLVGAAAGAQQDAPSGDGQDQSVQTLKVNVNVVNLFFNVKDKHGLLIPNLTKNDFQVVEDGRPQTIKYFSDESNQPLTLGILIDSSVSQERVLPMEKEVGAAFLSNVLRPKDLAFVISFDVNVDLLQDFTNSTHELRAALDRAKINGGGGSGGLPG